LSLEGRIEFSASLGELLFREWPADNRVGNQHVKFFLARCDYCILNEAGEVIWESQLPTTPRGMEEVFRRIPRSRIARETGTHSPWVSRQLNQLGHEVIVAHARNVRLISESSRKDDRLDARTLARLARIDPALLSPVRHRSAKAQIHLTVIRARATLVSARTALVNAARGLTKSHGARLPKCGSEQMNP
jgi:hypothetical protein